MLEKMKVLKILANNKEVYLVCSNGKEKIETAISKELNVSLEDKVWVFRDEEFNYHGFHAVALLVA